MRNRPHTHKTAGPMRHHASEIGMRVDRGPVTHEDGPMRRSVQVDEHLKIGFYPTGVAWAEASVGEDPETFIPRALEKAGAASSADISGLCKRWAERWNIQNGRPS